MQAPRQRSTGLDAEYAPRCKLPFASLTLLALALFSSQAGLSLPPRHLARLRQPQAAHTALMSRYCTTCIVAETYSSDIRQPFSNPHPHAKRRGATKSWNRVPVEHGEQRSPSCPQTLTRRLQFSYVSFRSFPYASTSSLGVARKSRESSGLVAMVQYCGTGIRLLSLTPSLSPSRADLRE
ncbi:hypothetical protein EJ06DRAFT_206181 [Trichodelitschia bisporula]|uniref:Uncharacterized protein n=1 Tax=Trichodelitschia bisporula TaxID=703511 RepID=A0A6G1I847_9PEZI|nr:hypothetical protein EJ06DRAFT_206181 [Trichodelitschia bisporula]